MKEKLEKLIAEVGPAQIYHAESRNQIVIFFDTHVGLDDWHEIQGIVDEVLNIPYSIKYERQSCKVTVRYDPADYIKKLEAELAELKSAVRRYLDLDSIITQLTDYLDGEDND